MDDLNSHLDDEERNRIQQKTGLRLSTYFSALKVKWLLNNSQQVRDACDNHRCMFGTVDSWLLWVSEYYTWIFYFFFYSFVLI